MRQLPPSIGVGRSNVTTDVPLIAPIDPRAAVVRCAADSCGAVITRVVWRRGVLHSAFSGEWREGDDKVWRLTDYARHQRRRGDRGIPTIPSASRRNWSEPATWGLVVRARPCRVECPGCGQTQVIA